jgi:hypothetical protein
LNGWLHITLPYAVFRAEVRNGVVMETAPIGSWLVGRSVQAVRTWVARKGGTILTHKDEGVTRGPARGII